MQTNPVRLIEYFDGRKQSLIPLFQRPYTWQKDKWETLWQDIIACDASSHHFMGAIVSLPVRTVPVGVTKHLIIDGQQRLTTIAILLCAVREFLDERTKERILDMLVNRHDEDADRFKLLPTQSDRQAYETIVLDRDRPEEESRIFDAYDFFSRELKKSVKDPELKQPSEILEILEHALRVVMINLDDAIEDPYEIFESLNFKGEPLTPADLIRNYVLMRFKHSLERGGEQEQVHDEIWRPIEELCSEDLPGFLFYYCRVDGSEVRKRSVYPAFKSRVEKMSSQDFRSELMRMKDFSKTYPRILDSELEKNEVIQKPLNAISRMGVFVATPLLMKLLHAADSGSISVDQCGEALFTLESYFVRRSICNLKSNALDSMIQQILRSIRDENVDIAASILKDLVSGTGNLRWPKDSEFREKFATDDQYGRKATNYVLWRLEKEYGHKEQILQDGITTEHILPQTLSAAWVESLTGETAEAIDRWVDTIGNLTLTGYNPELSNMSFEDKKLIYANSNFELTKAIAKLEHWDLDSIKDRGHMLSAIAVSIWPGPPAEEA